MTLLEARSLNVIILATINHYHKGTILIMPATTKDYKYIQDKISLLRQQYAFLQDKPDSYVFSALCVRASFYKNSAIPLTEDALKDMMVDSTLDGGVDVLLTDPLSANCDLVICQSKFYQSIKYEEALNALIKMANFYKGMIKGQYENVNQNVSQRFMKLHSYVGDESKIIFVLYTSAPQKKIDVEKLQDNFMELFSNRNNIELVVMFASDIVNEIKEAESRLSTIEYGEIFIDSSGNFLTYNNEALIVNVSAFSIKKLYAQYNNNLLARNLRYHIKGPKIDQAIKETIDNEPELFWIMNNGITIICDEFNVDGKEVKLKNFSIINGGQTVYMISKSKNINKDKDFYLTCKIIRARGTDEDEKNAYSVRISKAANWQKPIKEIDLRANSPEQIRFARAMNEAGIFYQTKRGEAIPKRYTERYLITDLTEVGKLGLCAIFQLPGTSRNKPSTLYSDKNDVYSTIFNSNQAQIASICKELLYVNYYFDSVFIKKYDKENESMLGANDLVSFANNSRTTCIAFVALASRYNQGNITDTAINQLARIHTPDEVFNIFRDLGNVTRLFPEALFSQKDKYNFILEKLFRLIISHGITMYTAMRTIDPTVTASNFLKIDKNYHTILYGQWPYLRNNIQEIFEEVNNFPGV